ncbi:MAG: IS110 family transposase, partial [Nostoc sp.]
ELRRYRGGKNLPNKSDPADALAMAAYGHDPDHHLENGELNLRYFLMHRPEPIDELRDLCQQLEHLNRVQSPIVNYARQLLAWQFPEVAHT